MSQLTAHFADQQSAMAAMDKLMGRGLGHARVQPLVDRPAEADGHDENPAEVGRSRLEITLDDGASESEVRDVLSALGATAITGRGSPGSGSHASADPADDDVTRAIAASERGATGAGGPPHDTRTERSVDDKRTRHDPRR